MQSYRHLGTIVQAGAGMGRETASRANAGQAATHALARRLLGNEGLPRHVRVQVAKACVASRCMHQAGTWDGLQGHQLQRLKVVRSRPWRIIAGAHRPPPPGQGWKSIEVVQKELQVAELEDELASHEASVHGEGGQIGTALCAGNAADGDGGGVEKCCGGRHGVHVPAPFAQA